MKKENFYPSFPAYLKDWLKAHSVHISEIKKPLPVVARRRIREVPGLFLLNNRGSLPTVQIIFNPEVWDTKFLTLAPWSSVINYLRRRSSPLTAESVGLVIADAYSRVSSRDLRRPRFILSTEVLRDPVEGPVKFERAEPAPVNTLKKPQRRRSGRFVGGSITKRRPR